MLSGALPDALSSSGPALWLSCVLYCPLVPQEGEEGVFVSSVTVFKVPYVLDTVVGQGVSTANSHSDVHCLLISGDWRIF